MLRAICFDVGGVVIRISTRWHEMLQRAGLPIPAHIHPETDLSDMPLFDPYQAGDVSESAYLAGLSEFLGGIGVEKAAAIHLSILIEAYPGVDEIVQSLNAAGIATGCLSNTNAPHWNEFLRSDRFPAIPAMKVHLASFEIHVSKPDERAFRIFQEKVGCNPDGIILFDDSARNCDAAIRYGWRAERIDPAGDPAAQIESRLRSERFGPNP